MTPDMSAVGFTEGLPITDPRSLLDVTVPRPSPGPRDLLVEVRAVSVNPVDVKRRVGEPVDRPVILGWDAAGIVRDVGAEVTLFAIGDEVFYAGAVDRPGTNSQFHVVDERIVGPKPAELSFAEAAALPLTAITAWEGLFDKLALSATSEGTLLIIGATGGVGSMVLQLATALLPGLRLIATASRPEGQDWARSLGAHDVVDHRGDLRAGVLGCAPRGVDFIFSTHSQGQLDTYVDILKPFGQIVAIDNPNDVDVAQLKQKSLSWHWEYMFARSLFQADDMIVQHEILSRVAELVARGAVVSTATTFLEPIDAERLREAHRLVETGHVIGKVVLSTPGG